MGMDVAPPFNALAIEAGVVPLPHLQEVGVPVNLEALEVVPQHRSVHDMVLDRELVLKARDINIAHFQRHGMRAPACLRKFAVPLRTSPYRLFLSNLATLSPKMRLQTRALMRSTRQLPTKLF